MSENGVKILYAIALIVLGRDMLFTTLMRLRQRQRRAANEQD